MNKDTIYIEPEDDITDIITKIENSKSKIVALVPPKKAGVFRSVVNIKLISKASKSADKTVVLVTVDPSITKLAAVTKLPVAKDLNTAPVVPTIEDGSDEKVETESTEEIEEPETEDETEDAEEEEEGTEEETEEAEADDDEKSEEGDEEDKAEEKEESEKKSKKADKKKAGAKKSKNGFINWIRTHKKLAIVGLIGLIALIGFLIWALFIAPAVDIFVSIKTDSNNFSEVISFVKDQKDENIEEGKAYLEERKIESVNEVNFEATGEKNVGEKASGDLVVYAYFKESGSVPINAGTAFTISGLTFYADESITLSYKDDNSVTCDNADNPASLIRSGCLVSGRVKVTAGGAGEKYNIQASNSGWSAVAHIDGVYSDKAMSGGTDNIITVVQQSDIEKAKNELQSADEEENKKKLYDEIYKTNPENSVIILESTFDQETSAATATPAVDEEVKDGVKPTLKATTTAKVYIIDKTKLEELIKTKANLPEDKKIFKIDSVYIDGFKELDSGFTGKLKAVYFTGPKITESDVVEKVKGKGLGDAQREIRDIDGVVDAKMDPSYPWVMKVPTDSNRITVTFEIKDQNGNEIKEKQDNKDGEKSENSEKNDEKSEEDKKSEEKQ